MTKRLELLAVVGCVVLASGCSAPLPPVEEDAGELDAGISSDAGETADAGTEDGGLMDAGVEDAGIEPDAGMDAGVVDAGCVATAAAQVVFVSAPQTVNARMCSALKVQLQTACGVAVSTAGDRPVSFSATAPTTEFFGDPLCIGKPSVFVIPGGASSLDVYFWDIAQGMSTLSVASAGLDGGSHLVTTSCAAGEKPCNGNSCIPVGDCCTTADCTNPKVCAAGQCEMPDCPSFVHSCSTFTDLSASGANRTVTFSSGYQPKCVRISTSQTIQFPTGFNQIEQVCGPREITISAFGVASGFGSFGTYGYRKKGSSSVFDTGAVRTP